ncbi:CDP-alcohol phosphatidyltransferase family protein [Bacteroidota bacterium]
MKKHLPNFITLVNLFSGTVALYMVLEGHSTWALIMLGIAFACDFLDGFSARLLHVVSPLGKQLDSLADLVSFGVVPAAMTFIVLKSFLLPDPDHSFAMLQFIEKVVLFIPALIPLFSALRLAKFNLQEDSQAFYGLPTPAYALFWTGIYMDILDDGMLLGRDVNSWLLIGLIVFTTIFMVLPLPMISLKIKNFSLRDNIYRYLLVLLAVVVLAFTGVAGLSIVIVAYILLSLVRIILT